MAEPRRRGPRGTFLSATESARQEALTPHERELTEQLGRSEASLELYTERLAELEFQLEDWGWQRINAEARREFSRQGLRIIIDMCRLYAIKNPLIKHAIEIERDYVFGQGISVVAKDPDVNTVVQAFMDDPKNMVELTGHQALGMKQDALKTDANIFLVVFTNPSTGQVRVRSIPVDEINDIITDDEDRKTVRFYERRWTQNIFDMGAGVYKPSQSLVYYPDIGYNPAEGADRPDKIGAGEVRWDQPIYHVKVGGLDNMRFGIPEVYAALDWAKAVRQLLEDYATIQRALSRFATQLTTKAGPKAVAAAKAKMSTTYGSEPDNVALDRNPSPVTGSMFISTDAAKLEAFKTGGAAENPESGRRVGLMVTAALAIPEPMLFGNAEAGNYATAKTLDRPTELKFANRQRLWGDVLQRLFKQVIVSAIESPSGPLAGAGVVNRDDDDQPTIVMAVGPDGKERSHDVIVHFPDVVEHDPELKVAALIDAATLKGQEWSGMMPPKAWLQSVMQYLRMENVDELIEELYPEGSDDLALPAAALAYQQAKQDAALELAAARPAPVMGDGTAAPGAKPKPQAEALADSMVIFTAAMHDLREALRPIVARKNPELAATL